MKIFKITFTTIDIESCFTSEVTRWQICATESASEAVAIIENKHKNLKQIVSIEER